VSEHERIFGYFVLSRFFRGKQEAKEIYEQIVSEELYTSMNILEETTYILMKLEDVPDILEA